MPAPEVHITGVGMVTPGGRTARESWDFLLAGGLAVRPVEGIDLGGCRTDFAGWVGGINPLPEHQGRDRLLWMAIEAASEACRSAALSASDFEISPPCQSSKTGISIGTSKGGIHAFSRLFERVLTPAGRRVSRSAGASTTDLVGGISPLARLWADIPPDAAAREIAHRFGITGGTHVTVAACTTGTLSIIRGIQMIQDGDADIVLAGSADASVHPLWFAAFEQMGVLAAAHPSRGPGFSCRPFDRTRDGFAVGEGAAILVLESAESARHRGVETLARITGYASGTDPTALTQLDPDGEVLTHVIHACLGRSGRKPEDLAAIYAHGTGTPANDAIEAVAFRRMLGSEASDVPVVSLKGALGHLLGAAGSVETAVAALACRTGRSPGNPTLLEPDPAFGDIPLPTNALTIGPGPILKTSMGFGGHVAALLLEPA